ncbi:60S ribosomal protein L34-B-like isoform X1 [Acanthaster planci]|uniref:Large ribosomal subunit protein eL34 n=2 Tax=Acanthaster planci TaxID=133434 RepID=A0A8B7XHN8_ACAPL|nr:60S ribosomal protein L34-B-like isoform X1 [Acanthaster planci]
MNDMSTMIIMVQRLHYRRRHSYNTKSNKVKIVKTPGGKLVYHYLKKKPSPARCGDTGVKLMGVVAARPKKLMSVPRPKKRVTRAYGGCLSAGAVKQRIIRAFLIEEQKIVRRVLKAQQQAKK